MFKTYRPEGVGEPYGSYVHALEVPAAARLIYLSGQIPVRPDGICPEGMEAQATVCWENIVGILHSAGLTTANLIRTTQYLVDPRQYQAANTVRARFLGTHRTASVAVAVPALIEPDWLIEIDAIAAV
jgi:2-iminobutanoate/2-iminopropanoate deaminase